MEDITRKYFANLDSKDANFRYASLAHLIVPQDT
jgi:hypothetical protein